MFKAWRRWWGNVGVPAAHTAPFYPPAQLSARDRGLPGGGDAVLPPPASEGPMATVGEKGPELTDMPPHTAVELVLPKPKPAYVAQVSSSVYHLYRSCVPSKMGSYNIVKNVENRTLCKRCERKRAASKPVVE